MEKPQINALDLVLADAYRQDARAELKKEQESFDRCDTDGYVTQFCHGLGAQKKEAMARVAENGGTAQFPGLYTLAGQRVRAKLIETQYGEAWALCEADGKFTGVFVSAKSTWRTPEADWTKSQIRGYDKRVANLAKKGFCERLEWAPAAVCYGGNGKGFSGLTTVYIKTFRTDGGFPETAVKA